MLRLFSRGGQNFEGNGGKHTICLKKIIFYSKRQKSVGPRLPSPAGAHGMNVIHSEFNQIQVSLVIRGRYVPLFWTANTEFADKKTHFDYKFDILGKFYSCG
jgi:hypothetical protein